MKNLVRVVLLFTLLDQCVSLWCQKCLSYNISRSYTDCENPIAEVDCPASGVCGKVNVEFFSTVIFGSIKGVVKDCFQTKNCKDIRTELSSYLPPTKVIEISSFECSLCSDRNLCNSVSTVHGPSILLFLSLFLTSLILMRY